MKKRVLVLGCTGSIGTSTLSILEEFHDKYEVCGLTAHSKEDALAAAADTFHCSNTLLTSTADREQIRQFIASSGADIAVNGIAGSAGLWPSVCVLEAGIDLALANKETIVMAAPLVYAIARRTGAHILPVDSEHSAVFTLIEHYGKEALDTIVITASGGPFRKKTMEELKTVTVQDALKHPTWDMGAKITIDSATLANKGLEVIEACRLFQVTPDQVQVTVHPQSIVHSLIKTKDGMLYGQLSKPDMRHPIVMALSWPEFYPNSLEPLDLFGSSDNPLTLTFEKPDTDKFPMLRLAFDCAGKNGGYTIAFNAANEVAVAAFRAGTLSFTGISELTAKVCAADWTGEPETIDEVFAIDAKARAMAQEFLK
ncbi:MAG: 1-deoxy-D-xylulose-5-phosphate reductoisomerase [Treponemataceae bacterium]|nr:1-deoxy-D-xylulose-5-phosphate reductoisomerase [Treponemataceae bacterium]